MMIGVHSCCVAANDILQILIFETQLCSLCQLIIASAVLMTLFSRWLPCIHNWCLKACQFSWLLLSLRRHQWWISIQQLPPLTFGTFITGQLIFCWLVLLDIISINMRIWNLFIWSMRCCQFHSFCEYLISEAVMWLGEWVVYQVRLSWQATPNEYARSGSIIQPHLVLIGIVHRCKVINDTEML